MRKKINGYQYLQFTMRSLQFTIKNATLVPSNPNKVFTLKYLYCNREFELTNHLGNVQVTISDKRIRIPNPNNNQQTAYYLPEVLTTTDYYPFGMQMPSRTFTATAGVTYKFGFNGKQNDNEITGWQDYGMREYDTRIARFISVDPLKNEYPELTPYQFASNTPIRAIDLDGLERLDYNYMPEAEPYKPKFQSHSTNIKFLEFTFSAGGANDENGVNSCVKVNYTTGIATDDAGVTHFSMKTDINPDKNTSGGKVYGASVGADVGYRYDNRATFRKTLQGDGISISDVHPSSKLSFGFGASVGANGFSISLGYSFGFSIDYTSSSLIISISLSVDEAKQTHTDNGQFWSLTKIDYDTKTNTYSAVVSTIDIQNNNKSTNITVYSKNRKQWESKAYSDNASKIENEESQPKSTSTSSSVNNTQGTGKDGEQEY